MPKLLEPSQRFAVVLESDKDKPQETQPVFWALAVSARDGIALLEKIKTLAGQDNADAEVFKILEGYIVDWSNMTPPSGDPIPFDKAKFQDLLTVEEAWELLRLIRNNNHLTIEEKKS